MSEPTRNAILALATMLALYSGVYASASLLAPKLFLKYLAIRDWSYGIRGRSSLPDSILNYPLNLIQKAKAFALIFGGSILGFYAAGAVLPDQLANALSLPGTIFPMGKVAVAILLTAGFVEQEERVSHRVGEYNPDHLAWHRNYDEADADIRGFRDWDYPMPRLLSAAEESIAASPGARRRWTKLGSEDAKKGFFRCALTSREDLERFGEGWNATRCGDAYRGGWYSTVRELEKRGWRNGSLEAKIGTSLEANSHEQAQSAEALAEARTAAARKRVQIEEKAREEAARVADEKLKKDQEDHWSQVREWDALVKSALAAERPIFSTDDDLLGPRTSILYIESNEAMNKLEDIRESAYDALDLGGLQVGEIVDLSKWADDIVGLKFAERPLLTRAVRQDSGIYIELDALGKFKFDYTKDGIISLVFSAQYMNYIGVKWGEELDRDERVLLRISRLSGNRYFLKNHNVNDETADRLARLTSGITVRLGRLGCFVRYAMIESDEAVRQITLHLSHCGRARIVGRMDLVGPSRRTLYS